MPLRNVRYEARGPVRVLTIDRPERRNAIDPETARELQQGVHEFRDDESARVLVVTGARTEEGARPLMETTGKAAAREAFCSGADLRAWRDALADGSAEDLLRGKGPLGFTRLDVGKPTVAAIDGWCLAGGMEIAAWCDIRIAGGNARFGLPNRRWNILLVDGGTQRLPRIVGLGNALDLVLTGRRFTAEDALRMGFVSEVVPADRVVERAVELAQRIAEHPQDALLADRAAVLEGLGRPLEEGLEREMANLDIYDDPEVLDRTLAKMDEFLEGAR